MKRHDMRETLARLISLLREKMPPAADEASKPAPTPAPPATATEAAKPA